MQEKNASLTQQAETVLLSCDEFQKGVDVIRNTLISKSIREYFETLLNKHNIKQAEAVKRADLDKDFGRQLIIGERMGRRDYYIQLAFGIGLSYEETKSLLAFLGIGQLYALRKRDAAIIYALNEGLSLMDTQILLYENKLCALSDEEGEWQDIVKGDIKTSEIENEIKSLKSFNENDENESYMRLSVNSYFTKLITAKNISRKELIERAGLIDKINYVFQVLSGTRTAKNRDIYLRLCFALDLSLEETQKLLKLVKKGSLYALKERDAAIIYCLSHKFTLEETLKMLEENGIEGL